MSSVSANCDCAPARKAATTTSSWFANSWPGDFAFFGGLLKAFSLYCYVRRLELEL
jgi:hypothetical protein